MTPLCPGRDLAHVLAHFAEHGFARLGPVLSADDAQTLAARADDLMMGVASDPGLFFQHDADSGRYEDLVFNAGWVGPSRRYRKLERLELDPLFAGWIENPLFGRIARALLGTDVRLYRSVLWNKAPGRNMAVPWHQDDGAFWGLDRPPSLQLWTALDDAPVEAGCLEVVPGSHLDGLATPQGGTLTAEDIDKAEAAAVSLPARRGEALLVHNHVWHRTRQNTTGNPRRAVSVSLLSGDVRCRRRRRPRAFRPLYGSRVPSCS